MKKTPEQAALNSKKNSAKDKLTSAIVKLKRAQMALDDPILADPDVINPRDVDLYHGGILSKEIYKIRQVVKATRRPFLPDDHPDKNVIKKQKKTKK